MHATGAVAMQGTKTVLAHQALDSVLATGLSRLTQVEKYTRGAINPMTGNKGRPDQPNESGVLLGAIGDRLLEPFVVATWCDFKHLAHHLDGVFVPMGLDELVRLTDLSGTHSLRHGLLPGLSD